MNIKDLKKAIQKMGTLSGNFSKVIIDPEGLKMCNPTEGIIYTHLLDAPPEDRVSFDFKGFKKVVETLKIDVDISVFEGHVVLDTGRSVFTFVCETPDFEDTPSEYLAGGHISTGTFGVIKKAVKAAKGNEKNPALEYVLLESEYVVSSNAEVLYYEPALSDITENILMSKKLISLFDGKSDCSVGFSEKSILLTGDGYTVEYTKPRCIYPVWRSVIPEENTEISKCVFNTEDLLEVLREASTVGTYVVLSDDLGDLLVSSHDTLPKRSYSSTIQCGEFLESLEFAIKHTNADLIAKLVDSPITEFKFWGSEHGGVFNDHILVYPLVIN